MKNLIKCLFLTIAMTVMLSVTVPLFAAGVPLKLSYQGFLTQNSSAVNGQRSITISLYDSVLGGNLLWGPETQTVNVYNGNFSAVLGNIISIDPTKISGDSVYVGLTVNGSGDSEMAPRQRLTSVPFAFNAYNGVPQNAIIMWSGAINQIPIGWALCDGTNGTPNLKDRFVVGAGNLYAVGVTGGSTTKDISHTHTTGDYALNVNQMPTHTHTVNELPHSHTMSVSNTGVGNGTTRAAGAQSNSDGNYGSASSTSAITGITINNAGLGQAHNHGPTGIGGSTTQDIMPPYYALAYIMKL